MSVCPKTDLPREFCYHCRGDDDSHIPDTVETGRKTKDDDYIAPNKLKLGPRFQAKYKSWCLVCREDITPGQTVRMTTIEGRSRAVCCYNEE